MPEHDKQTLIEQQPLTDEQFRAEIPPSHNSLEIDLEAMTARGVIEACDGFRKVAEANPELANKMAERGLQSMREQATMRQNGMNEQEIKSRGFAAMAARNKLKMREELPKLTDPGRPKAQPVEKPIIETTLRIAEPEPILITDTKEQAIILQQVQEAIKTIETEPVDTKPEQPSKKIDMQPVEAPVTAKEIITPLMTKKTVQAPQRAPLRSRAPLAAPITAPKPTQPNQPLIIAKPEAILEVPIELQLEPEEQHLAALTSELLQPTPIQIDLENQPEPNEHAEPVAVPETEQDAEIIETVLSEATPVVARLIETTALETEPENEEIGIIVEHILQIVEATETQKTEALKSPQITEATQEELEDLVVSLCGQLDIEYTPEDIQQFIAVLQKPDVRQAMIETKSLEQLDLEHLGTHEARHGFSKIVGAMSKDIELDIKRLIGVFALLQATNRPA